MKKPIAFYPLCLVHLFLSLNALGGGGALILSPDGSLLGLPPGAFENDLFSTFLIPGIILFVVNGVFPLFILVGLIWKPDWTWANVFNIYSNRHWAWTYSIYSGIISIIWITVQLFYVEASFLQPLIIWVGLLILILTLTPSVMRYYLNPSS